MKDFLFSNVSHFRYERKFCIESLIREEVESLLRLHPAIFQEIYHERRVNNIYFDSFNHDHYIDNVEGSDRKLKVRIRWYGESFGLIECPTLELKLKHNLHVGKLLYPLKPFSLDENFSIEVIRGLFRQSSLHETVRTYLNDLNFSLLNTYRRKYFLSSDRHYRVTIDFDMEAYDLAPYRNTFLNKTMPWSDTILEIKYNKPHDEFVDRMTNHFPFRMTKSSKYVDGLLRLCRNFS